MSQKTGFTKTGFTLIEIIIASALLVMVGLIGYYLLFWGIKATDTGTLSAQIQQDAKTALSAMTNELRQAVPLPNPDGTGYLSSAVILPGPGGYLSTYTITDQSGSEELNQNTEIGFSIGCGGGNLNNGNCVVNNQGNETCPFNSGIQVGSPNAYQNEYEQGNGFLIFSELISAPNNPGAAGEPEYLDNPANYEWVMYQVSPSTKTQPAELVRYTFPAGPPQGGSCRGGGAGPICGLSSGIGGWNINYSYFVPANSNEAANGNTNPAIISLTGPSDELWIMASHQPTPGDLPPSNQGGLTNVPAYSPNLFTITVTAGGAAISNNPNTPLASAVLSSTVQTEGTVSGP